MIKKFLLKKKKKSMLKIVINIVNNNLKIAVAAGWENVKNWKDSNRKFSVFLLRN